MHPRGVERHHLWQECPAIRSPRDRGGFESCPVRCTDRCQKYNSRRWTCWFGVRCVRSEWDDGGEQTGSGYAASEYAAEFDGVDRYVFCPGQVGLVGVGPTGRASELEHEARAM